MQLENDLQIYKTITVHRNSFLASILGYQKSYKWLFFFDQRSVVHDSLLYKYNLHLYFLSFQTDRGYAWLETEIDEKRSFNILRTFNWRW